MDGVKIRDILANNIKTCRENRFWSQAELAEYSDISIPFLSEIERGNKWPFPDTLGKIAKALNVQIHELFWEGRTLSSKEQDFTNFVIKEMIIAQKVAADSVIKKYFE